MIAQQEYFMALKQALIDAGYDVYDNQLPPNNTPYPFVYLAGSWQNPQDIKAGDIGMLTQIVQVWGTANQRGTLSRIAGNILAIAKTVQGENYAYKVRLNETEQQILDDNTTSTPLMQAYTSLRVSYSRR